MSNRKGLLRWLKAALVLGGLPLTMSAIGSSLTGKWITVNGRSLFLFDSDDLKSESPKAKESDLEEFTTGVEAILSGEERFNKAVKAFRKLRRKQRLAKNACVINNLAIAYYLNGDKEKAKKALRKLKKMRDRTKHSKKRERLHRNCTILGFWIST